MEDQVKEMMPLKPNPIKSLKILGKNEENSHHFSILKKLNFKTPSRVKTSKNNYKSDSYSGSDYLSTAYHTPTIPLQPKESQKNEKMENLKNSQSNLRGSLAKL